jgi:hypothetical protein
MLQMLKEIMLQTVSNLFKYMETYFKINKK